MEIRSPARLHRRQRHRLEQKRRGHRPAVVQQIPPDRRGNRVHREQGQGNGVEGG